MNKVINRIDYTKNLQKMMNTPITGVFTAEDEFAVKKVQENANLPIDGTVDYQTFLAIRENKEQSDKRMAVHKWYGFEAEKPMSYGDYGIDVEIFNLYLSKCLQYYGYQSRYPRGKYYNKATAEGVDFLHYIYGIDGSPEIASTELLYAMRMDLVARNTRQN